MPTPSSTQANQSPEPVTPRPRADASAELGGEGGSYGELTQSDRARREHGAAADADVSWRLAPAVLVALLIAFAVILAVTLWVVGV